MTKYFLIIVMSFISSAAAFGQSENELFEGEHLLSYCELDLPFTWKKKDELMVAKMAKELEGIELIYLVVNRKLNTVTYKRYYLVSEKEGKEISNLLIDKVNFESNSSYGGEAFKRNKKFDRFYIAKSFFITLKANKQLVELLIED